MEAIGGLGVSSRLSRSQRLTVFGSSEQSKAGKRAHMSKSCGTFEHLQKQTIPSQDIYEKFTRAIHECGKVTS